MTLAWNARRRRGRLRRLPQPALGRRLRQGQRRAAHRHRASAITGLENARRYYYRRPRARRGRQRERSRRTRSSACRTSTIGWANLQWPPTHDPHRSAPSTGPTTSTARSGSTASTSQPGADAGLLRAARLRSRRLATRPTAAWTWVEAAFNTDAGNNDEFVASLLPEATGTYDYAYRYIVTDGRDWVYADLDGIGNGYTPGQAGALTVIAERRHDARRRRRPGSASSSASPAGIELAWDAVARRPVAVRLRGAARATAAAARTPRSPASLEHRLHRHERDRGRRRTTTSSGRSTRRSTAPADSAEVSATAELRTVTLIVQRHRPGDDGRDRAVGLHRRLPRPARRRPAAVEPGRRRR